MISNNLATEIQSKTIDWLRFPLSIAVIVLHMNPDVNIQEVNYLSISGNDLYQIIATLGSRVLPHIAVPCFFMFSGFLFFFKVIKWNKNVYLQKVKSRFKTLILPYFLWNLIPVFLIVLTNLIKRDGSVYLYLNHLLEKGIWEIFWNYNEWGHTNTNILGWPIPNYAPYVIPLWFLRNLIGMVFLSPVIYYLVKYMKVYGIVLLGILYYTKIGVVLPGFSTGLFLTAFFFFSLGAYFSINKKNIILSFRSGKKIWLVLAIIFMILSTYYDGTKMKDYFFPIFVFTGVISIVNFASFLVQRDYVKVRKTLANASFFVYAVHGIFILSFLLLFYDRIFHPESGWAMLIRYFIVPLLCGLICLALYFLMKKYTPAILNLLTGDR